MTNRNCFEVVFCDGNKVVVDEEHLWSTFCHNSRQAQSRGSKTSIYKRTAKTTSEIKATLHVQLYGLQKLNHSIPNITGPIDFPKQEFDIDPNYMGYYTPSKITDKYLYASAEQRLELLKGMMDRRGCISKRGYCTYGSTKRNLVFHVEWLCMSLGIKTKMGMQGSRYLVYFTTDLRVFDDPKKYKLLRKIHKKSRQRMISEVNPVPSVPVKCIQVEADDHLFLIGEGLIPTHNTIAAVNAYVAKIPLTSNAIFRWIAPIYSQTFYGYRYARKFLPKTKHIIFNKSDPSIHFEPINTTWEFRTGKDPESLEGEASAGNILDECSKMSEDVYAAVRTTVTVTRGPIMAISTPRGKNWFYQRSMAAKNEMEWAIKRGKTPHRIFLTAPTADNPYVSQEAVEDARKSLPYRLFRQYYLAEFVDSGSTFAEFRECFYTDRLELPIASEKWFDPKMIRNKDGKFPVKVVIGADWAKKVDHTVFTAWDYVNKKMIGFWRFQGISYIEAVQKVYWFGNQFQDVELLIHDQTGIGEVINDLLDKTNFPYQGVNFTNHNKTFMVNNLIISFEQNDIKIPHWPEMVNELDCYEVQTNEIGGMKFSAPKGMHDDIVSSMILGWAAVSDFSQSELSVKIIEELKNHSAPAKNDWINDYQDDEVENWESTILRPKRN